MIQLIMNIYIATVVAAIIAFVMNFIRLNKYYKTLGLQAVFNEDSLACLFMCFVPIINIRYGLLYWNGSQFTDKDFEEYFKDEDNDGY